jgi:5,10-methylenetetrahydromethanopterin reductase
MAALSGGIEVDIRVPVGLPIPEVAEFIQRCEDAGLDGVGVHDHPHSGRDVYVTLTQAASRTSRLRLYPATSNTVTRHPLVLAALANSLHEVAPGRTFLSLAPGFSRLRQWGAGPHR